MSGKGDVDLPGSIVGTWLTCHGVTIFLLENLPEEIWESNAEGISRRSIREIVSHMHNVRCMWMKMLGKKAAVKIPEKAERASLTRTRAIELLDLSSSGVVALLQLGLEKGGKLPGFPPDVTHFLGYMIAHEAHHRGQICLMARALGHRLSDEVAYGLWDWSRRAREAAARRQRSSSDK